MQIAQQMLSNVFAACNREPNSVPLEALCSYSNYRKERYALQKSIIAVMMLLFLLLPLLFMAAEVQLVPMDVGEDNPSYKVSVSGRIPIRQIQATMGERSVPIYELSSNEFMIQPRDNGELQVSVLLANRQESAARITVDAVDMDPPQLLSTRMDGDELCLYVQDSSGVDFKAVRITDAQGNATSLLGWDEETGCMRIDYPEGFLNMEIPDLRDNVLQLELKLQ